MTLNRNCKTCMWWDIESAKDSAGRVRKDRVARCRWPIPPLPDSCDISNRVLFLGYMAGERGVNCPCYKVRL